MGKMTSDVRLFFLPIWFVVARFLPSNIISFPNRNLRVHIHGMPTMLESFRFRFWWWLCLYTKHSNLLLTVADNSVAFHHNWDIIIGSSFCFPQLLFFSIGTVAAYVAGHFWWALCYRYRLVGLLQSCCVCAMDMWANAHTEMRQTYDSLSRKWKTYRYLGFTGRNHFLFFRFFCFFSVFFVLWSRPENMELSF